MLSNTEFIYRHLKVRTHHLGLLHSGENEKTNFEGT